MSDRSNSDSAANMWKISFPPAVVVSIDKPYLFILKVSDDFNQVFQVSSKSV
jgi:hypothetical protein